MSPDTCIYYIERTERCRSKPRPNCPFWYQGECRCKGKIGKEAARRGD